MPGPSSPMSGICGNERPPYPPQCRGCADTRVRLDSRSAAVLPGADPTTSAKRIAAERMGNGEVGTSPGSMGIDPGKRPPATVGS